MKREGSENEKGDGDDNDREFRGLAWQNVPGPLAERLTEAQGKVAEAERLLRETDAALTAAVPLVGTDTPEEAEDESDEGAAVREFRARSAAARCMCYAAHNEVYKALMAVNLQRYGDGFHLEVEEAWEDLEEEAEREAEQQSRRA